MDWKSAGRPTGTGGRGLESRAGRGARAHAPSGRRDRLGKALAAALTQVQHALEAAQQLQDGQYLQDRDSTQRAEARSSSKDKHGARVRDVHRTGVCGAILYDVADVPAGWRAARRAAVDGARGRPRAAWRQQAGRQRRRSSCALHRWCSRTPRPSTCARGACRHPGARRCGAGGSRGRRPPPASRRR